MNPTTPLDDMCARIESAWLDRRDPSVVDRLAAECPEHAEELREFFAALVLAPHDVSLPAELARQAAEITRRRRGAEPRSFVKYLSLRVGATPTAIVRRIGGVSWEFLVMISRYPHVAPAAVREELAARIARAWPATAADWLERIEASGPVPTAASRREDLPPPPSTFDELLDRSALEPPERSYWSGLAGA